MSSTLAETLWGTGISLLMIFLTVLVHYEVMYKFSNYFVSLKWLKDRGKVVALVGCIFVAHFLEILLYSFGYYFLHVQDLGEITGIVPLNHDFGEYFYYSLVSYTSLGIGDMFPTGAMRVLTGIEALNGLVLIAWSASFTYLFMEKFWEFSKK